MYIVSRPLFYATFTGDSTAMCMIDRQLVIHVQFHSAACEYGMLA